MDVMRRVRDAHFGCLGKLGDKIKFFLFHRRIGLELLERDCILQTEVLLAEHILIQLEYRGMNEKVSGKNLCI